MSTVNATADVQTDQEVTGITVRGSDGKISAKHRRRLPGQTSISVAALPALRDD